MATRPLFFGGGCVSLLRQRSGFAPALVYTSPLMPIIDEELFVRCRSCAWEAATGIRRTEDGLKAEPPGERRITCHRCGTEAMYGNADYFHRTVDWDREKVDV